MMKKRRTRTRWQKKTRRVLPKTKPRNRTFDQRQTTILLLLIKRLNNRKNTRASSIFSAENRKRTTRANNNSNSSKPKRKSISYFSNLAGSRQTSFDSEEDYRQGCPRNLSRRFRSNGAGHQRTDQQ